MRFSRLIGWSTGSPWTHVALAFRWPALAPSIMVFESVQTIGVRAVPLAKFIRQSSTGQKPYPGKILLARHEDYAGARGGRHSAAMKRLADFAVDRFGDPFCRRARSPRSRRGSAWDRCGARCPNQ